MATGNKSTAAAKTAAKKTQTGKKTASKSAAAKTAAKGTAAAKTSAAGQGENFTLEVILWILVAVSVLLFLSNFGLGGTIGNAVSSFFFGVFGLIAYVFPPVLLVGTFFAVSNRGNRIAVVKLIAMVLLVLFLCMFVELIVHGSEPLTGPLAYQYSHEHKTGGGFAGGLLTHLISSCFGQIGAYVIDAVVLLISLVLLTERSALRGMQKGGKKVYESAKTGNERYRARAELRREEREQRREERELRREEMAQRRMDRKVQGVAIDTRVVPEQEAGGMSELYAEVTLTDAAEASAGGMYAFSPEVTTGQLYETTAPGDRPAFVPVSGQPGYAAGGQPGFAPASGQPAFAAGDQLAAFGTAGQPAVFASSGRTSSSALSGYSSAGPAGQQTAVTGGQHASSDLNGSYMSVGLTPQEEQISLTPVENTSGREIRLSGLTEHTAGLPRMPYIAAESEVELEPVAVKPEEPTERQSPDLMLAEWTAPEGAENGREEASAPEAERRNPGDFGIRMEETEQRGPKADISWQEPVSGKRMPGEEEWPLHDGPEAEWKTGEWKTGGEENAGAKAERKTGWQEAIPGEEASGGQEPVPYDEAELEHIATDVRDILSAGRTDEPAAGSADSRMSDRTAESAAGSADSRMSDRTVESAAGSADSRMSDRTAGSAAAREFGASGLETAEEASAEPVILEKPYVFPPVTLLNQVEHSTGESRQQLQMTAQKLQQTLKNFGVSVTITNISCGPAVTRYELQPEMGVRVNKIVNLADDIKLNLAAADIRIEAPIPGKAAVGIEVPNKETSMVAFRELIEADEFQKHESRISFCVGKDIAGKPTVADIAKMPHLLIAGATGSGKSVCINTIVMSILYKADPKDVKLIMVDPKVVELSIYNGIPHLMIPVVTDPKKAAGALQWAVVEMDERYQKFAEAGVRDLKGYNAKIDSLPDIEGDPKPEKLPQIVIIVDELADLMMVAAGEVEESICRLAQLARACGIHLILATQRPSVNVITGLIKANMPSRIAFAVTSGTDSRTILDMVGAEKLLGKGDMLFHPQGIPKPVRVQGAFVSDREVSNVVEFLKEQNGQVSYRQDMEAKMSSLGASGGSGGDSGFGGDTRDAYFADAARLIVDKDKASIGMLQRYFKVGFNRAARIMDQLEEAGVVGPDEGTKPRSVLMSPEQFEQYKEEYL